MAFSSTVRAWVYMCRAFSSLGDFVSVSKIKPKFKSLEIKVTVANVLQIKMSEIVMERIRLLSAIVHFLFVFFFFFFFLLRSVLFWWMLLLVCVFARGKCLISFDFHALECDMWHGFITVTRHSPPHMCVSECRSFFISSTNCFMCARPLSHMEDLIRWNFKEWRHTHTQKSAQRHEFACSYCRTHQDGKRRDASSGWQFIKPLPVSLFRLLKHASARVHKHNRNTRQPEKPLCIQLTAENLKNTPTKY